MPYMTPRETTRYRRLRMAATAALAVAVTILLLILPAVGSFGGFSGWMWLLGGIAIAVLMISGVLYYLADTLTVPPSGSAKLPTQRPAADNFHVLRLPASRLGVRPAEEE